MPYIPQNGSLADRVTQFFLKQRDEELTSGDIAQKFNTNANSVSTLLASCLANGLLVRRKDEVGQQVFVAGPKLNSLAAADAAGTDTPPEQPPAAKRRSLLPLLDPEALIVRRDVQDPGRVDQRRAAYFAALDKLDAPRTAIDIDRRYRGALAKAAQDYAKLPGNADKRFAFRTHPEQPQALCLVLREA